MNSAHTKRRLTRLKASIEAMDITEVREVKRNLQMPVDRQLSCGTEKRETYEREREREEREEREKEREKREMSPP
jgi:hypothetical protein